MSQKRVSKFTWNSRGKIFHNLSSNITKIFNLYFRLASQRIMWKPMTEFSFGSSRRSLVSRWDNWKFRPSLCSIFFGNIWWGIKMALWGFYHFNIWHGPRYTNSQSVVSDFLSPFSSKVIPPIFTKLDWFSSYGPGYIDWIFLAIRITRLARASLYGLRSVRIMRST